MTVTDDTIEAEGSTNLPWIEQNSSGEAGKKITTTVLKSPRIDLQRRVVTGRAPVSWKAEEVLSSILDI